MPNTNGIRDASQAGQAAAAAAAAAARENNENSDPTTYSSRLHRFLYATLYYMDVGRVSNMNDMTMTRCTLYWLVLGRACVSRWLLDQPSEAQSQLGRGRVDYLEVIKG